MEIGRDVFLEVVAGHSPTNDAANEVVAQHLADFHPARVGIYVAPRRILGVFAHPDDEVFCVGGTMATTWMPEPRP